MSYVYSVHIVRKDECFLCVNYLIENRSIMNTCELQSHLRIQRTWFPLSPSSRWREAAKSRSRDAENARVPLSSLGMHST